MQPAEALKALRQWWTWAGTLEFEGYHVGQSLPTIALVFGTVLLLRHAFAEQWQAATKWATELARPILGDTLTAAWYKAVQGVPAIVLAAAFGVLVEGGDLGGILKIEFYAVFTPLLHEALRAITEKVPWLPTYKGGRYPAAGSLKPETSPLRVLDGYDGDDAPSNPPPPRVPPAAVLPMFIAIGLGLSQTCCTGSLVTAQHDALRARYGSTPGDVGYAPSQHCIDLDDAHITWGGIAVGSAVVTGASGVATLPAEELPEKAQGPARYTAAGVALGAAVLTAAALDLESGYSESWVRDGCQP